jgi:hypothetical protein
MENPFALIGLMSVLLGALLYAHNSKDTVYRGAPKKV